MIRLISMAFVFHSVFAFGKHPVHFTIVNMDLDLAKNELTYSIRLFQEDMNTLFMDLYHEELFHSSDTFDFEKNQDKFIRYFKESLQIYIDGARLEPELNSQTNGETEYWLYFRAEIPESAKLLRIKNTLFISYNKDQLNLLIFSCKNKEKGLTFGPETIESTIKIDDFR